MEAVSLTMFATLMLSSEVVLGTMVSAIKVAVGNVELLFEVDMVKRNRGEVKKQEDDGRKKNMFRLKPALIPYKM